jgi:hypothetical protein
MPLLKGSLAATVLMAACCLSVPATSVRAQSASPDRFTPAPELSDQKLEAAAAALERVSALQKDYKQRVPEAKAPAEKERSRRR